jgi:hypothetical protein
LEVTILDPIPRNCGPLLRQWTAEKIVLGLERRFLVTHPAMIIPLWLDDITEFGHRECCTVKFAAALDQTQSRGSDQGVQRFQLSDNEDQTEQDFPELKTAVGRHFYEALYGDIAALQRSTTNERDSRQEPSRSRWWWNDPAIVKECHDRGTTFEMVIYQCQKSKT